MRLESEHNTHYNNYLSFIASSGLKDPYSDMVAGEAGPSRINKNSNDNKVDDDGDDDYNDDDNLTFKRRCKPVVAIPDR